MVYLNFIALTFSLPIASFCSLHTHTQALWDLDVAAVTNDLGSDIPRWERLLMDLRKSGGNIEGPAQVQFGPVVVQVRSMTFKSALLL